VFPLLSVTVQVTVVIPNGKADGALLLTEATPQLSAVVGVPNETPVAVQLVLVVAFTFAGQEIVGAIISITVLIVTSVVTVHPLKSEAVTV
jgi:hypothetical protein